MRFTLAAGHGGVGAGRGGRGLPGSIAPAAQPAGLPPPRCTRMPEGTSPASSRSLQAPGPSPLTQAVQRGDGHEGDDGGAVGVGNDAALAGLHARHRLRGTTGWGEGRPIRMRCSGACGPADVACGHGWGRGASDSHAALGSLRGPADIACGPAAAPTRAATSGRPCRPRASGLISGTTSGTPSVMRKAEELSTTVQPAAAATGAYFLEMDPPAEKSAMSQPLKLRGRVRGQAGMPSAAAAKLGPPACARQHAVQARSRERAGLLCRPRHTAAVSATPARVPPLRGGS